MLRGCASSDQGFRAVSLILLSWLGKEPTERQNRAVGPPSAAVFPSQELVEGHRWDVSAPSLTSASVAKGVTQEEVGTVSP